MFILPPPLVLCWDGLFTKKNPFYHYLVFQGLLQFLCMILSNLPRLKLLQVYLQFFLIHYCDDFDDWKVNMLLELSHLGFLLYLYCSFLCPVSHLCNCFVLVIVISSMFRTAYYFFCLLRFLTPTCFGLFTDIQFSLNQCFFSDNSCIDLSYPVWQYLGHCSCRIIAFFFIEITFCYVCYFVINLFYRF